MRILVIGPTQLTKACLQALIADGKDEIAGVFALSDNEAAKKARAVLFEDVCGPNGIPLYKVDDINSHDSVRKMRELKPDVIFQLGWSQIFSREIIRLAPKGCIGVHASLLPRNRGGASLNWALIKGERKWGVSLFYMSEKVDSGDLIGQCGFDVEERDDIRTLHDKSDLASAQLLLKYLPAIRENKVKPMKVDYRNASYLKRRKPEDGIVDWNLGSREIYDWVRGQTHPFPGSFTFWKGRKLFIWKALPYGGSESKGKNGEILGILGKKGIVVKAAGSSVLLERIQLENEPEMWADDFAEFYGLKAGETFSSK